MAVKKTDFVIKRGTERREYIRGVEINGEKSNLTIIEVRNHKKGIFHVEFKLTSKQITGDNVQDQATLKTASEMAMFAINNGEQWRKEWYESQPKDPAQTEMFATDVNATMGFVPED